MLVKLGEMDTLNILLISFLNPQLALSKDFPLIMNTLDPNNVLDKEVLMKG